MNDTIEDARRLVPWAEPNTVVFNEPRVEQKLLDALGGPIPPDLAVGAPLLRFCDADTVPLLDAMVFGTRTSTACCERCGSNAGGKHRLLVPMGESVVAYHCCWFCRNVLTDCYSDLVWD